MNYPCLAGHAINLALYRDNNAAAVRLLAELKAPPISLSPLNL
jgi:hypothetical protein